MRHLVNTALVAAGLILLAPFQAWAQDCAVNDHDLRGNAALSFEDFDQRGALASTARKLSERHCFREAAEVGQHYLLFGPELSERQRNVVTWHVAQDLALSGRSDAAAALISSTLRPALPAEPDGFEWNTYVRGTWAFLVRRRDLLDDAVSQLQTKPGQRNAMNARVLGRLQTCWDKTYAEAYTSDLCRPPSSIKRP